MARHDITSEQFRSRQFDHQVEEQCALQFMLKKGIWQAAANMAAMGWNETGLSGTI
jgi:hypothetical protein